MTFHQNLRSYLRNHPAMKFAGVRKSGLLAGWFLFVRRDGRNRFDEDAVFFPGPRAI